jgi:hypothetical protein
MAMLRICAADGCNTKTLGRHCIEHEAEARLTVVAHRGSKVEVANLVPASR